VKFALSWIREFVEIGEPAGEIARRLTDAGLPVETVTALADGDAVLDVEVFPNRPDALSVYGIAREVAAALRRPLAPYAAAATARPSVAPSATPRPSLTIEAPDLCGRYSALIVRGVSVGPSPDWLACRLLSVGLRPVNNIVDATNHALWEFGHPLHAFDLDTLKGPAIRVRRAVAQESIRTLDGQMRKLEAGMLVIGDADRGVAIAGVMGGADTMVTGATTSILLESAHFDPVSVRRTSRRLGLSTDASYRFERGADIEATVTALRRSAELIVKVAGGMADPVALDERPRPPQTRKLTLRVSRTARVIGAAVEPAIIAAALKRLEFTVSGGPGLRGADPDQFEVGVPSHRLDIEREVDLIEEVARSIGYDQVPERLPNIAGSGGVSRAGHRVEQLLRRGLESAGCSEAVTGSFSTAAGVAAFEPAITPVKLANPIAADQDVLRAGLLPGLLASVAHNVNRGRRDVRLFEIGQVFRRGDDAPPAHVVETRSLAVALTGAVRPAHWQERSRETGFYDMKGLMTSILDEAGLAASIEAPLADGTAGSDPALESAWDPGRSASIVCVTPYGRRVVVGRLGALARASGSQADLKQEVFVAEMDLTVVFAIPGRAMLFHPLPRYPAVSRDLSLIVKTGRSFAELERVIREAAPDRVVSVTLFDRYESANLPPGTEGLSLNVVYQHPDRTLASEEVMELQQRILESLAGRLGVVLREQPTAGGT